MNESLPAYWERQMFETSPAAGSPTAVAEPEDRVVERWIRTRVDAPHVLDMFAGAGEPKLVTYARDRAALHRAAFVSSTEVHSYLLPRAFDLAVVCNVLRHLADEEVGVLLGNLARSALPGARIVVREWCAYNLGGRMPEPALGQVIRHARDVRAIARTAGLACRELRAVPSIVGEVEGGWVGRVARRVGTFHHTRAAHVFVFGA